MIHEEPTLLALETQHVYGSTLSDKDESDHIQEVFYAITFEIQNWSVATSFKTRPGGGG